jgi:hypothetical protein
MFLLVAPTSDPPSGSANPSPSASVTGSPLPPKGLPSTTKIAIGVVVPVCTLFAFFLFLFLRHTRKERRKNTLPPPVTSGDHEVSDGHSVGLGLGGFGGLGVMGKKAGTERNKSRSRSRSASRGPVTTRPSTSTLGKSKSRREMRDVGTNPGAMGVSLGRKRSKLAGSTHSRNASDTVDATAVGDAGKRGVTFAHGESPIANTVSPDLDKARSDTDSEGSQNLLQKLGSVSGSSGHAPSTYHSLEPITEPSTTAYQSQSSSGFRPISRDGALGVPSNVAVTVYNNTERARLAQSAYATHQSAPLPPPSPGMPLSRQFIYESGEESPLPLHHSRQESSGLRGRRSTSGNRTRGSRGSRSGSRDDTRMEVADNQTVKPGTSWIQMNGPTGGTRMPMASERDNEPAPTSGTVRPSTSSEAESSLGPKKGKKASGSNLRVGTGRSGSASGSSAEPRWKQWRDRKSIDMLSPVSSPTSSEGPKLQSSYNAI